MKKLNIVIFAGAALSMVGLSGAALAASLEAMEGAWMISEQDCGSTFEKTDGSIRFRDATSSLATGIIIDGDRITGPNGTCTVKRIREDEGRLSLSMSCMDAVLASGMSASLRLVDQNTLEVSNFLFPEETQDYYRCPM